MTEMSVASNRMCYIEKMGQEAKWVRRSNWRTSRESAVPKTFGNALDTMGDDTEWMVQQAQYPAT